MVFKKTKLSSVYIIDLEPFEDERGLFARTFCEKEFEAIHHKKPFVQFNHSHTIPKATIRGLHYQKPPFSETKLIRCIQGSVYDVVVDIRKDSPTFLQSIGVELSAQNMTMIYIPEGFAHGFQTLEANTQLIYHHTNFYAPNSEGGMKYNDPKLNIEWPLPPTVLSQKDASYSNLGEDFNGIEI